MLKLKPVLLFLLRAILFIFLTITTQIGGVVYLSSVLLSKKWKADFKFKTAVVFMILYLFSTFVIVPNIAPIFGREKVKHSQIIGPTNYFTVLLNRNYVRPQLNDLLAKTESNLTGTNVKISYLDANFPFVNKFPLLPHLSHNDGKKIDLSLIYETESGELSDKQKSRSGYGSFENPTQNEFDQIGLCLKSGYFQYDYPKYLTFGKINQELSFSKKGTSKLIASLLKNENLGKLFIEPHLKYRMGLTDARIKYHGCRAVRHDDHIHIQL